MLIKAPQAMTIQARNGKPSDTGFQEAASVPEPSVVIRACTTLSSTSGYLSFFPLTFW